MAKSTSIAKITRPRVPDVLPRTRLFRLLDQTRRRSPVIWVSGPAGSGKTTLVSSYLDLRKLPAVWYQIDVGDADIASFFYFMGLAARKAAPRYKTPLPLLTPEYGLGVPTFTRRFIEDFCSRLKTSSVLVFDNYHEIPPESLMHEAFRVGLSALPETVTAIVISRSEPPASFAGLQAENKLQCMGRNELKLTFQETKGIAKLQDIDRTRRNVVEWLYEKARGWAAGVVLLTQVVKSEGIPTARMTDVEPEKVFDYFAHELFYKLSEDLRAFLVKTAVLPKISPSSAERLTGHKDSAAILARLNRGNYFTEKLEPSGCYYKYHPLFRDFLLREASSSDDFGRLRMAAARLLEEEGLIEDAAALFVSGGHWPELAGLIAANAQAMIQQGRLGTLMEWIEKIPTALVDSEPSLLYWKAACLIPFDPVRSKEHFQKACLLYKKQGNRIGMLLAWSAASDLSLHAADDFAYLDDQITFLNQMLAEDPTLPSPEISERLIMSMFNALALRQPWNAEKNSWEERASNLLQTGQDKNLRMYTGVCLICYHFYMGNMIKASRFMNFLRKEAESGDVSSLLLITIKTIDAIYSYFAADFDHSLRCVDEALRLSEKTGIHIWDNHLFGHACGAALSLGNTVQAEHFLSKMTSIRPMVRRFDRGYYHFMSIWRSVLTRDPVAALEQVRQFVELIPDLGFPFGDCICHFMAVQAYLEVGNQKQALMSLKQGSQLADRIGSKLFQCMFLLLEAYVIFEDSDDFGNSSGDLRRQGNGKLAKALTIAREQGIHNFPGWRSDLMAKLLSRALAEGIEAEYVLHLIRMRNILPDVSDLRNDNWPWPVKVYTLGQFRLELDGKPVLFGGKTPKKPLELLKAIIALGGREVSEEKVIDELWPEAAGDLAYKSFEMALQRLRKLLGNDKAVRRQEGRLTLDARYCWTDLWAFEQFVLEAEQSLRNEERKQKDRSKEAARTEKLEKAFAQYKGHFLPSDTREPWLTSTRERLRSKFLRLVTKAGEEYEQAGEWKQAIDCFELGLERDAACEEFYQHLMLCHAKLGNRTEAVKAYDRCRASLKDALGLEPSARTEEILASIRK